MRRTVPITEWCDSKALRGACYARDRTPASLNDFGECLRCRLPVGPSKPDRTRKQRLESQRAAAGPGKVVRVRSLHLQSVRANPGTLFVFNDNMQRYGGPALARQIRGEPNAVGIPTKREPANRESSYFKNGDLDAQDVRMAIQGALDRLQEHLDNGGNVVLPVEGIGTGLAGLRDHAPLIYRMVNGRLQELEAQYR